MNFREELIRGLEIALAIEDRDFKTLLIWMNPNHSKGTDLEVGVLLRKELKNLIENNVIIKHKSPKNRVVYSLKK